MTARKILLSGYYGFNNAGDEAVLAALTQIFQENFTDIELVALSAEPARTAERLNIRAIDRWDGAALKRELADAALFCSGGGSLFQDITSVRSVYYYAALLKKAQRQKVPAIVLAQGLGPLKSKLGRWLTVNALKGCRLLSWRDEASLKLAAELGLGGLPNYQVCDPVLLWQAAGAQAAERETIGLALRPWPGLDINAAAELVRLLRAAGQEVRLLPFYYGNGREDGEDERLATEINRALGDEPAAVCHADSPEGVYRAICGCKLVIGMRLHALIMAAAAGIPALAVSYDPKVSAFAAQMNIPLAAGGVAFAPPAAAKQAVALLEAPPEYPLAAEAARWQPLLAAIKDLLK